MVLRIRLQPYQDVTILHMHTIYSQTQNNTYTKMNLSTVKWAQWDKTQSRELLGLFICVCIHCVQIAHNAAQNRPDNFPSCPPITIAPMMSIWGKGGFTILSGHVEEALLFKKFFLIINTCLSCKDTARQSCVIVPRWRFFASFIFSEPRAVHFRPAF